MSTFTKIFFLSAGLVGVARAETPSQNPGPTQAKPEAPKPPAEIEAMAKGMVGTWKCIGSTTNPDGSTAKMTGKVTAKVDFDKWWINDVYEGRSDRGPFKMTSFSTFDAQSKKWRKVSIDSHGNQYVGTSDGMKDGKLVWSLDFMGAMGAGQFKDTVDPSDPKVGVKFAGVMSIDRGKSWRPVYEMTCKK